MAFVTLPLIGKHQKIATVYPVIYCRKHFDVINYVTFVGWHATLCGLQGSNLSRDCRSVLDQVYSVYFWKYDISDPTLTSYFFVLCTNMKVYFYDYS